ncbi:MAG: TlpA disulfide reductase family protein [Deltaproteobacteria bacterium]|nr:TlpA disulfide reductase family protein [Deltaproteobacteria bacterium]
MKAFQTLIAGMALAALAGCAPPAPMMNMPEAGAPEAGPADAAATCAPPALNNTCAMEGCDFANISLPNCAAPDTNFTFYGDNFCSNQLTLIVVSAGWCVPCQQEAAEMQAQIIEPYRGRVRVVTVYGQNVSRNGVSASECMQWKNRYGLEGHMVFDPSGAVQRYFPNMAYPANLIIDRQGRIRYRIYGTSRGLQSLKDQLDGLLSE